MLIFDGVVHNLGVLGHFVPWRIFGLEGIRIFWAQKLDKKNCLSQKLKNHTDFELYEVYV